jgi:glycyl-tRNA synthetase beta subunit
MKKLLYPLLALALLACKQKPHEPVKTKAELRAEYLKRALESDEYKNAYQNVKRVHSILDSVKKGSMDSVAAIFVYNNSIATAAGEVHTVAQVKEGMKKDTAYLKAVQLKVADDLALADSVKNVKH